MNSLRGLADNPKQFPKNSQKILWAF